MTTTELMSADEQEGLALVGDAEMLKIEDEASFQKAAELLRMVKRFRKRVAEITGPVIKSAHDAWKAALAQKAQLEGHAIEAEAILKASTTSYEQRVQRQREEAERQQERIRQEAEAAARAQQTTTTQAVQKVVEDQRLQAALEAEARGDAATAERILAQPVVIPVPPPPAAFVPPLPMPAIPRAEGLAFRDHYRGEVEDLTKLVKAIAAGEGMATVALIEANQSAIDALARTLKDEFKLPGVKLVKERKAAASA